MNLYRIMNRITKQWWEGEANSAQEACQKAGWPIGDCWVRQYSPEGLRWLEETRQIKAQEQVVHISEGEGDEKGD